MHCRHRPRVLARAAARCVLASALAAGPAAAQTAPAPAPATPTPASAAQTTPAAAPAAPTPAAPAAPTPAAPSPGAPAQAAPRDAERLPPQPRPAPLFAREPEPGAVRAACRDAQTFDAYALITGGALLAAGVTMAAIGLTTPVAQRTVGTAFIIGLGPGLGLGGIGVPFGRGIIREENPLSSACSFVLRTPESALTPHDIDITARLLQHNGQPISIVLVVLLGVATVAVGAFTAVAASVGSPELTQLAGGIAAAAITGWFIFPPTPPRVAGQRFVAGRYNVPAAAPRPQPSPQPQPLPPPPRSAVRVRPVFSGLGLGVVGSF